MTQDSNNNTTEGQNQPNQELLLKRRRGAILLSVALSVIVLSVFIGISVAASTPMWIVIPFALIIVVALVVGAKFGYKMGKKTWD